MKSYFILKISLLILLKFVCTTSIIFAQTNIGGIINTYTPVTSIAPNNCTNQLSVQSTTGFSISDRILIIQMKGATIDQTNTANFGNILSINDAGNYEFGNISAINGNTITLAHNLMNTYSTNGKVQLIRVPQYVNATVTSTLTASPWNGTTGGVLVFEVAGNLTLQANINNNGTGFRGGSVSDNFYIQGFCSSIDYFFTSNQSYGAYKGEGITEVPITMITGRGALANGGGGGNNLNAGGGGGSNVSNGGIGGNEWSGCSNFPNGGVGGKALLYPSKLFLGGGGGGHQNNNVGTSGSNGGGIIILKAFTLTSNNFSILNNGNNVTTTAGNDAAGGAGSGGTIMLDINNFSGNITITANGGKGGDVNNDFTGGGTGGQCHGPGGGGGGGLIGVTNAAFPANVITSVLGGDPGLTVNPQSACLGTSYGAASGQNGLIQTSIVLNESNLVPIGSVTVSNDTTVCNGTCTQLNATGSVSYTWSPSIGLSDTTIANPIACPTLTTTYVVAGIDTNNCTSTDTVVITVNPSFQNVQTVSICQGDSVFLAGNFQNSSGQYIDSLSTILGCDSLIITNLIVNPTFNDSTTISICQGDSIFLDGSFQHNSGIFTDSLQSIASCDSVVTTNLIVNPSPSIIASNDTTIEACGSIQLNANGGISYLWSPSTGLSCTSCPNPVASPIITTSYVVSGTTNGCSNKDTIIVVVEGSSTLIIPNVFTPNQDGINDGFNFSGGCLNAVNKKIFNRWGQLLFESNQIAEEWNGRTKAGEKAPEGTYFYIFTISLIENGNETTKIFKGTVTLLR